MGFFVISIKQKHIKLLPPKIASYIDTLVENIRAKEPGNLMIMFLLIIKLVVVQKERLTGETRLEEMNFCYSFRYFAKYNIMTFFPQENGKKKFSSYSFYCIYYFSKIYLCIHERERERGKDIGKERISLLTGSLKWDLIPELQDQALEPKADTLNHRASHYFFSIDHSVILWGQFLSYL